MISNWKIFDHSTLGVKFELQNKVKKIKNSKIILIEYRIYERKIIR